MKRLRLLFMMGLILGFVAAGRAQYPVRVQVNVVQPVPPYLPQIKADIAGNRSGALNQDVSSHLAIILAYTGRSPVHIKLAGSIERISPSPLGVSLRPDYQPAQPIIMGPQLPMVSLNKDMLLAAFGNFSENSLVFSNMDLNNLRQNGVDYKLPEGTYRVCVTAYDYDKGGFSTPLSAPGTGCAYFTICYTASAPQLILPVSTMLQSNSGFQDFVPHSPQVQFVWTPPATTCGVPLGALNYNLEIRRVFEGQTVTDGLSNPFVFRQENIPTTSYLLDTLRYAHVLVPGQRYIVRVHANFTPMPGSPLDIANQGYSQVAGFVYQPTVAGVGTSVAATGDTLPAINTTIKGRLQYHFPGDTSGLAFPVARENIYLQKVYVRAGKDGNGVMAYSPLSPAEQGILPPYQDMLSGMITRTDNSGNFQLQCGMTSLDSSGLVPDNKLAMLYATRYAGNAEIVSRASGTDALPAGAQTLRGNLACLYKVITTNPHYKPYAQYLSITPGGVRDVTNLVLDANSYTLEVNVREVFNNQEGNYADSADIKIYRLTSHKKSAQLGIPLYEGDLLDSARDWKEVGDKVLIAARMTPGPTPPSNDPRANTVSFLRLFRNIGSDPYDYQICLEKGGVVLQQVTYKSVMGQGQVVKTANANSVAVPQKASIHSNGMGKVMAAGKNTAAGGSGALLLFDEADQLFGKRSDVQSGGAGGSVSNGVMGKVSDAGMGSSANGGLSVSQEIDEWSDWAYSGNPDTALLTLKKELIAAPHSQVTGILKYQYKNDNGTPAQPYANKPVKLMVYYVFKGQPSGGAGSGGRHGSGLFKSTVGLPLYYSGVAMTYANQDGWVGASGSGLLVNPGPGAGTALFSTANGQIMDNGKVLQTVNTDANGAFTFDFENTDSTMQTIAGNLVTGVQPGLPVSGSSQVGQFTRVYRVVPGISYYCAPDDNIPVQPWGSYDCGTLSSYVHTYNLNLTVLAQGTGAAMNNIQVNLCRFANDPYGSEQPMNPAGSSFLNTPVSLSGGTPGANGSAVTGSSGAGGGGSSGGASRGRQVNFTLPVSYTPTAAVIKRQGTTDNNGKCSFNEVVVSTDGQHDVWITQANGAADQRGGSLTFATAYQVIPKDFIYSGSTASFSHLPGENPSNVSVFSTDYANFPPYSDPSRTVFNSEFDPSQAWGDTLYVALNPPRYAGRVVDSFTNLGVPNITVSLHHKNYRAFYTKDPGNAGDSIYTGIYDFTATTDANGYFDFTEFSQFYMKSPPLLEAPDELYVNTPGYNEYVQSNLQPLQMGGQLYEQILLSPMATNSFGYVADSSNPSLGVAARVKLKVNGRWVDTYSYSGDPNKAPVTGTGLVLNGSYYEMLRIGIAGGGESAGVSGTGEGSTGGASGGKTGVVAGGSSGGAAGKTAGRTMVFKNLQVNLDKNNSITGIRVRPGATGSAGNWQDVMTAYDNSRRPPVMQRPGATVTDAQRFDIDLPAEIDSIVIMPYDPAYMTKTFAVHPLNPDQNLGTFLLAPRVHHVLIQVTGPAQQPAAGAMVSIDGVPGSVTVDSHGQARIDFVNNALTQFMLRVRPNDALKTADNPAYMVFTPVAESFSNNDDGSVEFIGVRVVPAQVVTGRVTFDNNGQGVSGAVVYVDQGVGSNSAINTSSDPSGAYRLVGVPTALPSLVIKAAYTSPGKTYTGGQQTLAGSVAAGPVNLVIHYLAGVDMSRVLGFPARLAHAVKNSDNTYTIDGELYDLPANANFQVRTDIPSSALTFPSIKVKVSALTGVEGTPYVVPVDDSIPFDNLTLSVNVFKVFDAQVLRAGNGNLSIRKTGSDTAGLLAGQAHIIDNSFNFPSSYITISGSDFYLGNYGQAAGGAKLQLPIFPSDGHSYALTKFSITTSDAGAISFKYLGFNGVTGTEGSRESFVMGDSVNLFLNLTTTIQNHIHLQFKAGRAVIHHDGLSRMVNNDSIAFTLEQWSVNSGAWELSPSSGGIRLGNGVLHTGKADLPFTDMNIIAGDPDGELVCNSLNAEALEQAARNGRLTIGGGLARLTLNTGTGISFIYDPDAGAIPGQGHFKFTIESSTGSAAYFGGLDGMTNAAQHFGIQFLSELSDGEEIFAFDPKAAPVTFYNQVQFSPQAMSTASGRLVLQGTISTGVAHVPDNLNGVFTFNQVGAGVALQNKLSIGALNFTVNGDGGTSFTASGLPGTQLFGQYGIGIGGTVSIPGVDGVFKSNFISMVTSNAAGLIPANGVAAISGIEGAVAGAAGAVSGAVGSIGGAVNGVTGMAGGAAGSITGAAGGAIGGVAGAAGNVLTGAGVTGTVSGIAGGAIGGVTGAAGGTIGAVTGVTGAVGAAQQAITQQAEVWLGDVTGQAQAFADQAEDEVKGVVNDARNALEDQLNQAVNTLSQYVPLGAEQEIANIAGKWRLAGDGIDAIKDFNKDPAGSLMRLNGVLQGFTGINVADEASKRLQMIANDSLFGLQNELPVDQITDAAGSAGSNFSGMHFDFDLKNGRITGSLSMAELNFGAVVLKNIGIEMLMDRQGWYFYTGADMDMPQTVPLNPLLFPLGVGIIIGNYPTISADLTNRITANSYVHQLPKTYQQGIHGFFMTGKKDILEPTSVDIDFYIVAFEIGVSAGLDARMYANFGDQSQQIGLAGMEFGNVYASLSVLDGACGVSGNADLNVGIKYSFTNDQKGVTLQAAACASVTVTGSAWCAFESASYSKAIMGILTLCAGADCKKAVDLSIYLNNGGCSSSNDFDY